VGLPKDDLVKPPKGLGFPLEGALFKKSKFIFFPNLSFSLPERLFTLPGCNRVLEVDSYGMAELHATFTLMDCLVRRS
jgi:hypothetical protein